MIHLITSGRTRRGSAPLHVSALYVRPSSRLASLHNFSVRVTPLPVQNANMGRTADQLGKELVSSFKLVSRNLDAEETKRLSSEAKEQR